jgi:hypothetical protein
MKNLFNDISEEEKNRVLEMHSGKKTVISEQPKKSQLPSDNSLYIEMTNYVEGDGPEVMKYVPNKMLVIGQSNGTKLIPLYTITKHN